MPGAGRAEDDRGIARGIPPCAFAYRGRTDGSHQPRARQSRATTSVRPRAANAMPPNTRRGRIRITARRCKWPTRRPCSAISATPGSPTPAPRRRFFTRDGKYFVRTDGPDGKLADFEIKYTFGVYPLQQYLIELPGGRLQALGDRLGHAAEGRRAASAGSISIPTRTCAPATRCTGPASTRTGISCAPSATRRGCARTSTRPADAFDTTWAEINVACEACHGPGADHVAWARAKREGKAYSAADSGLAVALERAQGRHLDAGAGDGQRAAQRAADVDA